MAKDSSTPKKKAALPNKLPNAIKEKILKMTKKIEKKENIMKALKKSKLASSAMIQRERMIAEHEQAYLIHELNQRDIILENLKIGFREELTRMKNLEIIQSTRTKKLEITIDNQSKTIKMLQNKCKKESKRKPSKASKKM